MTARKKRASGAATKGKPLAVNKKTLRDMSPSGDSAKGAGVRRTISDGCPSLGCNDIPKWTDACPAQTL
jgi:hypothetical protein